MPFDSDELNNLVWLLCDLQPHGKTIVRRGWREGLPKDKASVWVFCPLQRGNFPRDRELIEICESCEHCKGSKIIQKDVETHSEERITNRDENANGTSIKSYSKEDLEKAEDMNKIEDEKWLEDEKNLNK